MTAALSEPDNLKQTNNGKETDRGPGLSGSERVADLAQLVESELRAIITQREEIIRAFIAKYECQPNEIEQVEELTETGRRWYVRKRVADDGPHVAEVEYHVYECGHGEIAVKGGQYHPLCPKCDDAMADGVLDEDGRFQKWLRRRQCQSK